MSVAWKMTVDMQLGLFAVSTDDSCSVPGCHADDYQPAVINITPHHLWTRVSMPVLLWSCHISSKLVNPCGDITIFGDMSP